VINNNLPQLCGIARKRFPAALRDRGIWVWNAAGLPIRRSFIGMKVNYE